MDIINPLSLPFMFASIYIGVLHQKENILSLHNKNILKFKVFDKTASYILI